MPNIFSDESSGGPDQRIVQQKHDAYLGVASASAPEAPKSVGERVWAGLESFTASVHAAHDQHAQNFGAQMDALFRQGRDDLQDLVAHAFPDSMQGNRALGAPGEPPPQVITADLTGKDLYGKTPNNTDKAADKDGSALEP